jgi:hypothetical protein
VCPAGDDDLGKISQAEVIRYVERHAQDWSPGTGKAMCWSLRAFLRYLHHHGLNPHALAARHAEIGTATHYKPAGAHA